MTTTVPPMASSEPEQLRAAIAGRIAVPTDPTWDADRAAWNLAVDQQPAMIAFPATAADIAAVVRYARDRGLRVAPQSTGHNATPLGSLSGTVLLRTSSMRGVTIAPAAQLARAEAGAVWDDVTTAAAAHGLIALAGSSHDVGVTGYTLGGGLSWLARRHGLAANSVVAAEVVTADGEIRRVDAVHEPELFWALRGGGGSFAAVVALEFRLYPVTEIYAGALFWPLERRSEVLHAWADWTRTVPEEMTSVGRMLQFPPFPEIPEPLRGGSFTVVEFAFLGSRSEGDAMVASLRALGPVMDTIDVIPAPALTLLHMDPPEPVPYAGDGLLLADLPAEAVDAFVAVTAPGSPLLSVELRHLGGALGRPCDGGGAVDHLAGEYLAFAVGMAPEPAAVAVVTEAVEQVQDALAPWAAGATYLNFAELPGDPGRIFGTSLPRLRAVKAVYDPQNLFHANHPVGA